VIDPTYLQAITAAASGTVAALDAEHYLATLPEQLLEPAKGAAAAATSPAAGSTVTSDGQLVASA